MTSTADIKSASRFTDTSPETKAPFVDCYDGEDKVPFVLSNLKDHDDATPSRINVQRCAAVTFDLFQSVVRRRSMSDLGSCVFCIAMQVVRNTLYATVFKLIPIHSSPLRHHYHRHVRTMNSVFHIMLHNCKRRRISFQTLRKLYRRPAVNHLDAIS